MRVEPETAYIMIVFGILAVLIWVFWSFSHNMRSKNDQRRCERHIQIFTIERRPSAFPPSYEESQSQVCPSNPPEVMVSINRADMFLAPPLYSQDSSDVNDCRWCWEHPPRYSLVVQTPHRQVYAGAAEGCLLKLNEEVSLIRKE
ncbi:transmembrane protein 252-like [Nothobranchius furzeri]|uniref:transmembrane protein 252-like n=1 Tax=Nothobranchius furzeri TaxID=105023 RepID=UPI0024043E98|nr:transmembrane protein 252-like [Nothobranchius furzeri]